nr:NAD-dependent epimerase/dehydratase family protein [Geminicoccus flavidas]
MTVLVTGATGLVGTRLLPRLVQVGVDCRALMRSGKEAPAGVSTIAADLFDPDSLMEAMGAYRRSSISQPFSGRPTQT